MSLSSFAGPALSVWRRHFGSGIEAITHITHFNKLAVGCEDGSVMLLDTKGNTERLDKAESSVNIFFAANQALFVGTEDGLLRKYDLE